MEIDGALEHGGAKVGDTRREFLLYGAWAAMAAGLGGVAGGYLLVPPARQRRDDGWRVAGDVSGLQTNQPVEMFFQRFTADGWKSVTEKTAVWVVKRSDGAISAFEPHCTHLGCAYRWEARSANFVCPCHNSRFGLDGSVLSGPAPRPLNRYRTRLEGGSLYVAT